MNSLDETVASFLRQPDRAQLSPAALRLARRLPRVRRALDAVLEDPLERALAGLAPAPVESEVGRAVLAAVAAWEGGQKVIGAAELEDRVRGDPTLWPLAAQVHAAASVERERQGRMALSVQDLPFVLPGELDPTTVEVLAVGARVLPALHVDWARKLTDHAAQALVLDCRSLGLWFWPVLRSMTTDRLVRPVQELVRARRLPPGARGMAAAYAYRLGQPWEALLRDGGPTDHLVAALGIIGERPHG